MILNTDPSPDSIVSLGGINLKNVAMFKYLGAYIDSKQPSTGDSEFNQFAELSNFYKTFMIILALASHF